MIKSIHQIDLNGLKWTQMDLIYKRDYIKTQ